MINGNLERLQSFLRAHERQSAMFVELASQASSPEARVEYEELAKERSHLAAECRAAIESIQRPTPADTSQFKAMKTEPPCIIHPSRMRTPSVILKFMRRYVVNVMIESMSTITFVLNTGEIVRGRNFDEATARGMEALTGHQYFRVEPVDKPVKVKEKVKEEVKEEVTVPADMEMLKPEMVAKALSIGRSMSYKVMAMDGFPVVNIGGCKRVPLKALREWIERNQHTGNLAGPKGDVSE